MSREGGGVRRVGTPREWGHPRTDVGVRHHHEGGACRGSDGRGSADGVTDFGRSATASVTTTTCGGGGRAVMDFAGRRAAADDVPAPSTPLAVLRWGNRAERMRPGQLAPAPQTHPSPRSTRPARPDTIARAVATCFGPLVRFVFYDSARQETRAGNRQRRNRKYPLNRRPHKLLVRRRPQRKCGKCEQKAGTIYFGLRLTSRVEVYHLSEIRVISTSAHLSPAKELRISPRDPGRFCQSMPGGGPKTPLVSRRGLSRPSVGRRAADWLVAPVVLGCLPPPPSREGDPCILCQTGRRARSGNGQSHHRQRHPLPTSVRAPVAERGAAARAAPRPAAPLPLLPPAPQPPPRPPPHPHHSMWGAATWGGCCREPTPALAVSSLPSPPTGCSSGSSLVPPLPPHGD